MGAAAAKGRTAVRRQRHRKGQRVERLPVEAKVARVLHRPLHVLNGKREVGHVRGAGHEVEVQHEHGAVLDALEEHAAFLPDEAVNHGQQVHRGVEGRAALGVVLVLDALEGRLNDGALRRGERAAHLAVGPGDAAEHRARLAVADAVAGVAVDFLRPIRRVKREQRHDDLVAKAPKVTHDVRVRRGRRPLCDHEALRLLREELQDGTLDAGELVKVDEEAGASCLAIHGVLVHDGERVTHAVAPRRTPSVELAVEDGIVEVRRLLPVGVFGGQLSTDAPGAPAGTVLHAPLVRLFLARGRAAVTGDRVVVVVVVVGRRGSAHLVRHDGRSGGTASHGAPGTARCAQRCVDKLQAAAERFRERARERRSPTAARAPTAARGRATLCPRRFRCNRRRTAPIGVDR
mmetsp:Transcript_14702/g.50623  ORF Transcript_14702/g.50623 Transcript_14702/m.50623 type:complete len:404 (-) Transcript_14702:20-1231(-)